MARDPNTLPPPTRRRARDRPVWPRREPQHHALSRLWLMFIRTRVVIAAVVLALEVFVVATRSGGPAWLVLVCALHLGASLAVLLWRPSSASGAQSEPWKWLLTIGVDVVVFALLDHFQQGGVRYSPLFALPVLMAAILGPLTLALITAGSATLFLLGQAALHRWLLGDTSATGILQSALTSTGFFLVALLAHQLAQRLVREEALAQGSRSAARTQVQVNDLIIESLREGVLVIDRQGVVRSANPAAQLMLIGTHTAPLTGLLLSTRKGWESLALLVNKSFSTGQAMASQVRVAIDEQTPRTLFVRTELSPVRGGHPAALCVLFLEDLREMQAHVRTEKLAAMGRMSAAVAHEIRNPLSAITQANALLDEEVLAPGQKRLTRMIDQNAQRLARIVDDILNVAHAQPGACAVQAYGLPLDPTVQQIADEWRQQHHAQQVLAVHPNAAGVLVHFDAEHLRRLLVNLLDNALKHSVGGTGAIRVITRPKGRAQVRLSVWSLGTPLEASVRRHLFEPFFSSASRSSGLGLYICRELCERHGAQIAYQRSRLRQQEGNEFYVIMSAASTPF